MGACMRVCASVLLIMLVRLHTYTLSCMSYKKRLHAHLCIVDPKLMNFLMFWKEDDIRNGFAHLNGLQIKKIFASFTPDTYAFL